MLEKEGANLVNIDRLKFHFSKHYYTFVTKLNL